MLKSKSDFKVFYLNKHNAQIKFIINRDLSNKNNVENSERISYKKLLIRKTQFIKVATNCYFVLKKYL